MKKVLLSLVLLIMFSINSFGQWESYVKNFSASIIGNKCYLEFDAIVNNLTDGYMILRILTETDGNWVEIIKKYDISEERAIEIADMINEKPEREIFTFDDYCLGYNNRKGMELKE